MNAKSYKSEFNQWVKKENIEVLKSTENSDLKIGDKVTFTNDYGVQFENKEILGFRKNDNFLSDRVVYLDSDAYWFASKLKELKKTS
ncbi:MAG: hypothetical protein LC122_02815 [Chitinophagales bacterium]|nr:hypothetical protein [Chitinophagales bacterium]